MAGLMGLHLLSTVLLLTCAVSSLLFAPVFQAATQDRKSFKSQENVITNPQILAGEWRVGEVFESTFNSFLQGRHLAISTCIGMAVGPFKAREGPRELVTSTPHQSRGKTQPATQRAHPWASTRCHTRWFINHRPPELTGTP